MIEAISKMSVADWARVTSVPMCIVAVVASMSVIRFCIRLSARRKAQRWIRQRVITNVHEIRSAYQPPPHTCTVDFERSQIEVGSLDGSVLATCCIFGCGRKTRIGSNMFGVLIEDHTAPGSVARFDS